MATLLNSKKCVHCGEWDDENPFNCPTCGKILDEQDVRIAEKDAIVQAAIDEEAVLDAARTPFMRKMVKIGRFIEKAYMAFIGFMAWLIAWVVG